MNPSRLVLAVGLSLSASLLPAGEMVARVLPQRNTVYLTDGTILVGTTLFYGGRGLMLALEKKDALGRREIFIPKDKIRRYIPAPAEDTGTQAQAADSRSFLVKTYYVGREQGAYVLRDEPEKTVRNEKPAAESKGRKTASDDQDVSARKRPSRPENRRQKGARARRRRKSDNRDRRKRDFRKNSPPPGLDGNTLQRRLKGLKKLPPGFSNNKRLRKLLENLADID